MRKRLPNELEAIETANEDELRALKLQRLSWSIRHTYENNAKRPASRRRI